MKEKLNRLAKGMIETESAALRLLPECFSDTLKAGDVQRYELICEGADGAYVKGLCYSDNPRVQLLTHAFAGRRSHVVFRVDASFLAEGEVLFGSIDLITDAGEYSMLYEFAVEAAEEEQGGHTPLYTENRGFAAQETAETNAEAAERGGAFSARSEGDGAEEEAGETHAEIQRPEQPAEETERQWGQPAEAAQSEAALSLAFFAAHLPEDDVLLEELTGLLIRAEVTGSFAFAVYREAVKRRIELTRLYESYLAAYPGESDEEMPREVLFYFSYENHLGNEAKSALYANVLRYVDTDSELYRSYEPKIRDFAMEALLDNRMNEQLALLYDRMIYPDMIDRRAAQHLPDILKCCRITCGNRRMRVLTVQYPELAVAERYTIRDGVAYAPIYFEDARLGFLDACGARGEAVPYEKQELLHRPELLRRCFELQPFHPMLKLAAVREIFRSGAAHGDASGILRDALKTMRLSAEARERAVRLLAAADGDISWIGEADTDRMDESSRREIFACMMRTEDDEDGYLFLRRYGFELASEEEQCRIAEHLLSQNRMPVADGEADERFVAMCKQVFDAGKAAKPLLGMLTQYYEGATESMYAILKQAKTCGAPLHELPEKLLAALLFAGSRTHIDECFAIWAAVCEQKELLVRAYLSVRCSDYFVSEDENVQQSLFEALYSYISAADSLRRLPVIYLLALTKHYAACETLTEAEKKLCQRMADYLIGEGLVFAYTKKLRKKIRIPREICERYYIEYHGSRQTPPRLMVRISPEEDAFHQEEMKRVYQGIYVSAAILFMEDELHYLIYDGAKQEEAVQEGVISVKKQHGREKDRYSALDRMTRAWKEENREELGAGMAEYVLRDVVNRRLFAAGDL